MNGPARLIGRIILVLLCAGLVLCCAQESLAQLDRISVSVSGGAGYLPLKDWEDFYSNTSSAHFHKDRLGSYLELRVAYHITQKHALALHVERIVASASRNSVAFCIRHSQGHWDTTAIVPSVIEWDFKAVPIGLSYEFFPISSVENVSLFLGVGASYFLSDVSHEYETILVYDSCLETMTSKGTREGEGYGVHAYVGVQTKLTEHLRAVSRLRGRYSDGMAFTDEEGAVKVEFTGVDFTLGLGWRF